MIALKDGLDHNVNDDFSYMNLNLKPFTAEVLLTSWLLEL